MCIKPGPLGPKGALELRDKARCRRPSIYLDGLLDRTMIRAVPCMDLYEMAKGSSRPSMPREQVQAGGQGTSPDGINDENQIIGTYVDSNNAIHGFLRIP
jgi:hypothetical protein